MFSFDMSIEHGLPESFNYVGYESPYFAMNLGSLFVILVVQTVLIPFIVMMAYLCPKKQCSKVQKKSQETVDNMLNTLLATVDGTF